MRFLLRLAGQLCTRLASKGPDCLQEARRRSHEMCLALYSKPKAEVCPITPQRPVPLEIPRLSHGCLMPCSSQMTVPQSVLTFIQRPCWTWNSVIHVNVRDAGRIDQAISPSFIFFRAVALWTSWHASCQVSCIPLLSRHDAAEGSPIATITMRPLSTC